MLHAGSANRRSFGSTGDRRLDLAAEPPRRRRPSGSGPGRSASCRARRRRRGRVRRGSTGAPVVSASPKPAASRSSNRSDSGASTPAARSATSRDDSSAMSSILRGKPRTSHPLPLTGMFSTPRHSCELAHSGRGRSADHRRRAHRRARPTSSTTLLDDVRDGAACSGSTSRLGRRGRRSALVAAVRHPPAGGCRLRATQPACRKVHLYPRPPVRRAARPGARCPRACPLRRARPVHRPRLATSPCTVR